MNDVLNLEPDQMSDQFADVIEASKEVFQADLGLLLKTLKRIDKVSADDPAACETLRMKALHHYFMQRMTEAYPRVSPELFKMQRKIRLDVTGKSIAEMNARILKTDEEPAGKIVEIECDLFALASISAKIVTVGRYTRTRPRKDYRIRAAVPKGISKARNWSRGAMAHARRIQAELLECDELRFDDCGSILGMTHQHGSGAYVAWIPKQEVLYLEEVVIPKGDPVLLYKIGGEFYVCGLWDIPDEEPGEALLREFTEGSAKVKKPR